MHTVVEMIQIIGELRENEWFKVMCHPEIGHDLSKNYKASSESHIWHPRQFNEISHNLNNFKTKSVGEAWNICKKLFETLCNVSWISGF